MQLSVDIFSTALSGHYELKTDIQIKGVCVTKVSTAYVIYLVYFCKRVEI